MARRGYTKEQLEKTQKRIDSKEMAREYQQRSVISRKKNKALREQLLEDIGADEVSKAMRMGILKGDPRLIELFCKITGQLSEKLEIKQTSVSAEFVKKFLDKFHAKE